MQRQPFTTDPAHAALADDVTARLLSAARTEQRGSRTRRLLIAAIAIAVLAVIVIAANTGRASAQPCNPRDMPCRPLWTGGLDGHTVTILDAASGERLARLNLGDTGAAHVITFDTFGRRASIANFFAREIVVVDTGQ